MRIAPAALAILLAGIALGSAPVTKPADTTTAPASKPAPPLIMLDSVVKSFPAGAASLVARPDARNLRFEGRIREIRTITFGGAGGTGSLVLVGGSSQPDESPAFFEFTLRPPVDAKVDQIVRFGGGAVHLDAGLNYVAISSNNEFAIVGDPTVGNRLAGQWRCNSVILDGAAIHKDSPGRKLDNVPTVDFASPLRMNLLMKMDGTMGAELLDNETLVRKIAGKWTVTKDGPPETATVRLEAAGAPTIQATASFESGRLKMSLPGFADRHISTDSAFEKVAGIEQKIDWNGMKNQNLTWFNASTTLQPQPAKEIATTLSNSIDAYAKHNGGFACTIGSLMLKRGRAVAMVNVYNKAKVLEFSPAQTQQDGNHKSIYNFGELLPWGTLVTPEVLIENLDFDKGQVINPSAPLTGKVMVRATRRMPPGKYCLVMQTMGSNAFSVFEFPVSLRRKEFKFSFDPLAGHLPPTAGATIPVVFVIGRHMADSPVSGADGSFVISEPSVMLMDVAAR